MPTLAEELQAQIVAKHEEIERIGAMLSPTGEDATRAQKLFAEAEQLSTKLHDYNQSQEQLRDIQEKMRQSRQELERKHAERSNPRRVIPFSTGISTGRFAGNDGANSLDANVPDSGLPEAYKFQIKTGGPVEKKTDGVLAANLIPRFLRIDAGESELERKAPTGGFLSLGHFAWCVQRQGQRLNGDPHCVGMMKNWRELQLKAPSGMFEESDPDGGDLIPREFSNQVYERMVAMNQILPYLEGLPLSGNSLTIPALKEDSRQDGYRHGGVLGYWEGEADQYNRTRPQFRQINLRLHKLTVLTYVTEELLLDSAVALETYLGRLVPKEINFKINDALINGKGGGMPQGMLYAPSKLTATAVAGSTAAGTKPQGTNTFVYQNVLSMWARAIAGQRDTAIWLYGQDVEPSLYSLALATGTSSGVAVYAPNEPVQFKMMGRPALVMEQCPALGTEGDVILFCPAGYAAIIKGGLQSFMSMHLRFDYDEFAYKWRFRMDAQPYDLAPLTAYNGSTQYSSVVTLSSTRNTQGS